MDKENSFPADPPLSDAKELVEKRDYLAALEAAGEPSSVSKEIDGLCYLAGRFERAGDHKTAQMCLRRALEISSGAAIVRSRYAAALAVTGDLTAAVSNFAQALQDFDYPPPWVLNSYGQALSFAGESERAISLLRQAVALEPETPYYRLCLGGAYEKSGNDDRAEHCYEKAIAVNPGFIHSYFYLAGLLTRRKRFDEALTVLSKANVVDPKNAEISRRVSEILLRLGRVSEAWNCLRQASTIIADPSIEWYQTVTEVVRRVGVVDGIMDIIHDGLERHPESAALHIFLAEILEQSGRYGEAETEFRRALSLRKDDQALETAVVRLMLQNGDIVGATKYCREASKRCSFPSDLLLSFSDALIGSAREREAIDFLESIIEEHPMESMLYVKLAEALQQQGDLTAAVATFEKAVSIDYHLKTDLYERFGSLASIGEATKQVSCWTELIPEQLLDEGAAWGEIWRALNEDRPSLAGMTRQGFPVGMDRDSLDLYCAKTKPGWVLVLNRLTEEHTQFLASCGISPAYLRANETFSPEETGARSPLDITEAEQAAEIPHRAQLAFAEQLTASEEGFMRAVCPFSGEMLRSNRSFLTPRAVFHRFCGKEVFYLATMPHRLERQYIFIPNHHLVVHLGTDWHWRLPAEETIRLKADLIANWSLVVEYLERSDSPRTAVMIGVDDNLGYYAWHSLSALSCLEEQCLLSKIDAFYINTPDYFGRIEDLFPDIPPDRTRRLVIQLASQDALRENCFTVALGHSFLRDVAIRRVFEHARKVCPAEVFEELESAKGHFPLIWLGVRFHNKQWSSQVEGISQLISALHADYPDLALVFDGHTRFQEWDGRVSRSPDRNILGEKNIIKEIQERIPAGIRVFDKIGSLMPEVLLWAEAVDMFVTYWGTATLKPQFLAGKPGVSFGWGKNLTDNYSLAHWAWLYRENGVPAKIVAPLSVKEHKFGTELESFTIDWRDLLREARAILASINRR